MRANIGMIFPQPLWLDALTADIDAVDRSACDGPLEHAADLDVAAAKVAATPVGEQVDLGLDQDVEWHLVSGSTLEAVRERVVVHLDETATMCHWLRYGVAVAGEPGEERTVVVLVSEQG